MRTPVVGHNMAEFRVNLVKSSVLSIAFMNKLRVV